LSGVGCSGGGQEPGAGEFTSLVVTPATTTLFTVAPGNTVTLSVVARAQEGRALSGVGSPSFSSGNAAVAVVSDDGTVTAAGAGTASIAASLTVEGVTRTATAAVTVQAAPATASVVAPQFLYEPAVVDVSAGGTVTWRFGAIHHTVTFTSPDAPEDVPELQSGSASRTFPSSGTFGYRCLFHQGMTGVVRAH
jgi:plastocyanin